ncbi:MULTISPECIES: FecR domain-containing protein [unclassified Lysinibacillus]|uniref:FecR family protein n=1 Tax=unclassified Lysinibacillus TaxID=2636778 RepID=UPI00131EDAD8|nr:MULTISPECIES: FecR family protein [unclassified Lysinibacillus]
MKRWSIVTLIAIFLTVSIFSHVGTAEASTSRVAIISKVEGTVEVQKSGGKKILKGFKGMSLNQGDIVTTGKESSVVLKFSNGTSEDDTFVLESSAKVTFSKLSNKSGTITKVSMLKGKAWVDVKSIKNKDDEFVLETPTAIMGVRGTNFFVGVDPNTGLPSLAVLSGNVNVTGSGNNTDQFNVYPASALTVGGQDQLQMIPIDNQILAQMLNSTSSEVMAAILESAQKIISENQKLMNQFSTTTFPTEINQFPLAQNQYTDNVYNLLLALAEEAFKLNKIDGNALSELQQKIKEQQLVNSELHGNKGDVDWEFEAKKLSEQQRLEKLKAEQAKKDALKKEFLASEQKAKEDKLKQDRLDALEKLWLAKQSQAERDEYERKKQERLDEQQPNQGNSNSGSTVSPKPTETPGPTENPGPTETPKPTEPPTPTWPQIEKPFDLQLEIGDSSTAMNYKRGASITDLLVKEPIVVSSDDVSLVFKSTDPSMQLLEVKRDGEPIYELDEDDDGNGDGVFITHLSQERAEMRFTVTVKHNKLDTKEFNLNVATEVPPSWSDIEKPFDVQLLKNELPTDLNYSKSGQEDDITNLLIEREIPVNGDNVSLAIITSDQNIQILEIEQNGVSIKNPDTGFLTQLGQQKTELIFTITVQHNTFGPKIFKLIVNTVVQPFNIYEMWGGHDGSVVSYLPAPYTISTGVSNYDYVITVDEINFTEQYLNAIVFNRKDDADEMLLHVKVGDEWQPLEMNLHLQDSVEYKHYPTPGTDSIQYELVHTRDGITETYLINVPSIQWNN